MTTTRERALEAALRDVQTAEDFIHFIQSYDWPRALRALRQINAIAQLALALPPSQPEAPPVAAGEHTPGPWHIDAHKTTNAFIWGADTSRRGCIAQVNLIAPDDTKAEGNANAHLIAAAPDMLAALREAHAVLALAQASGDDGVSPVLATITVAIARATGGEG